MDKRYLEKINRKIRNSAPKRVVLQDTQDGSKMQTSQVTGLNSEALDKVERFQNYGFTSYPPAGSEAIAVPVGGDSSHLVAIAIDCRDARKGGMKPDEVAIYHANGDFIHLGADNKISTQTKEHKIDAEDKVDTNTKDFKMDASVNAEIKSPELALRGAMEATGYGGGASTYNFLGDMTIDGNLVVTGNVTVSGDVTAGGISLRNHTHPGDSGGTTGKPQ
jgi:phage baseplate assembly protein V